MKRPDPTKNDARVIYDVHHACKRFGSYIPHGSADWTAIRRLLKFGQVMVAHAEAWCESCDGDEPHIAQAFAMTAQGLHTIPLEHR